MPIANVAVPYTSSDEIRGYLSNEGVDLRLNDSGVDAGDAPTNEELERHNVKVEG